MTSPAQRRRAFTVVQGGKQEPSDIFFNPFLWWIWWLR
jgi:hypothetical protein